MIMDKNIIILIYYIFIVCGLFIFLFRDRSIYGRKYLRNNGSAGIVKKVINIINMSTHRIGGIFVNDPKRKTGIHNMRILKILEEDEGIVVTPRSFIGYKILISLLFIMGGIFFGRSPVLCILFGVGGGVAGYFIPDIIIRRQANLVSANIDIELPYMIDLLRVASLSGQNIYNSFKILVEKYRAKICFDLKDFIKDIDWGLGKEAAYNNLIEKNKSKQFTDLMAVLLEAEKYGSPLNEILEQKSIQINFENMENAERKARRISILTLIPLVFLILPAFVLLAGGPMIYLLGSGIFNY
jgi:pilus assembly protein TadC